MRAVGIICECNPFHAGHQYLIDAAKADGADAIVALMSGCFVQRGEAAVIDSYARAEILLHSGVDVVLELPFPFSSASAEFFGGAGVNILSRLGVDELWFGSECGNLDALLYASRLADSPAFLERYAAAAQEKRGTAQAYFEILNELSGGTLSCSPNDILAISYLRAIRKEGGKMTPRTLMRQGASYSQTKLSDQEFPSATALRQHWREEGLDAVLPYLPTATADILLRETLANHAPACLELAERHLLSHFRLLSPADADATPELFGGLGARLCQAAKKARSLRELLSLSATKKYPDARIRRGILYSLLGVTDSDLRSSPAYVRLLGATSQGTAFLSRVRKTATITVMTRVSNLPQKEDAYRQFDLETRANELYSLCRPDIGKAEDFLRRAPLIFP